MQTIKGRFSSILAVTALILPTILPSGPGSNAVAATTEAQPPVAGKVISVSGTVLIRSGEGQQAKSEVLQAGTYFHESDIINTSSGATVKLLFNDKSIMDIGPSSLFHVQTFKSTGGNDRQVDVNMVYGSVRAAITKPLTGAGRFRVRTPSATMGVRGTEFVVKSGIGSLQEIAHGINKPGTPMPAFKVDGVAAPVPQKMEVVVLQGKVNVETPVMKGPGRNAAPAAPISLTAGQGLVTDAKGGMPAAPVTLKADQMKAVASSSKVEDNTFKKAVVIDTSTNISGGSKNTGDSSSNTAKADKTEKSDKTDKSEKSDKAEKTDKGTATASASGDKGDKADTKSGDTKSASSSGSSERTPASAPAPQAPAQAPTVSTAAIITNVVVDSVAPIVGTPPSGSGGPVATNSGQSGPAPAAAPPAPDISSFIPVAPPVVNPVVIPAGGLKHVTIKVSR